jgi:hypothetical protein
MSSSLNVLTPSRSPPKTLPRLELAEASLLATGLRPSRSNLGADVAVSRQPSTRDEIEDELLGEEEA